VTAPINGVDVSSWHHPEGQPIDWEAVYGAGYRFAIVKATQGTTYVNPWVARDVSDALAAGLLVGAYHYYEAGEDPNQQAKWALSALVGQPLDLGLFVDWECYLPAKFIHTQELATFLAEARMTRPQTGTYCSGAWVEVLGEENVNLGRLWVAAGPWTVPPTTCFAYQGADAVIDGIPGEVSKDFIANTRSLDIPTSPAPRPTETTTHSLRALVEDEANEADAEESEQG